MTKISVKKIITCLFVLFTCFNTWIFADEYHPSIIVEPDEVLVAGDGQEVTVTEHGISLLEYSSLDDCETDVILTPFASRNSVGEDLTKLPDRQIFQTERYFPDNIIGTKDSELPNKIITELNEAFEDAEANADDLRGLTPDIEIEAQEKGVEVSDLVVRDIFDITKRYDGPHHDEPIHDSYGVDNIIIKTKTLRYFVCLLHYKNGQWNVVEDVEILDDTTLRVSVASLSPFAIVIHVPSSPVTPSVPEEEVKPIKPVKPQEEVKPIEPIEPIEPVEPVTPVEPIEPEIEKCCIYHWLILAMTIIDFLTIAIFKINDKDKQDEEDKDKKHRINKLIRLIVCVITTILSIIFYILGTCGYDIHALIGFVLVVINIVLYTLIKNHKQQDEK